MHCLCQVTDATMFLYTTKHSQIMHMGFLVC